MAFTARPRTTTTGRPQHVDNPPPRQVPTAFQEAFNARVDDVRVTDAEGKPCCIRVMRMSKAQNDAGLAAKAWRLLDEPRRELVVASVIVVLVYEAIDGDPKDPRNCRDLLEIGILGNFRVNMMQLVWELQTSDPGHWTFGLGSGGNSWSFSGQATQLTKLPPRRLIRGIINRFLTLVVDECPLEEGQRPYQVGHFAATRPVLSFVPTGYQFSTRDQIQLGDGSGATAVVINLPDRIEPEVRFTGFPHAAAFVVRCLPAKEVALPAKLDPQELKTAQVHQPVELSDDSPVWKQLLSQLRLGSLVTPVVTILELPSGDWAEYVGRMLNELEKEPAVRRNTGGKHFGAARQWTREDLGGMVRFTGFTRISDETLATVLTLPLD